MTFKQGWINRQFARVERDAKNWPEWMRRESDLRVHEYRERIESPPATQLPQSSPKVKTVGGN